MIRCTNNPNFNRNDIDKLPIGYVEFSKLEDKYASFRTQVSAFGGLFSSHLNKLKISGVKFDNENEFNRLLTSEGI